MRYVKNFGIFWYDFIVADDWTIAAGIVVIMVVLYLLEQMGIVAWWVFFSSSSACSGSPSKGGPRSSRRSVTRCSHVSHASPIENPSMLRFVCCRPQSRGDVSHFPVAKTTVSETWE